MPPNFFREVRPRGIFLVKNREINTQQRLANCQKLSVWLMRPGGLTDDEQKEIGMFYKVPGILHWVEAEEGRFICVGISLNERHMERWHPELRILQQASIEGLGLTLGQNGKKSGVNQLAGISVTPDGGIGSLQLCASWPKGSQKHRELILKTSGKMIPEIMKEFLPAESIEVTRGMYNYHASFGGGHHDNEFTSSIQCNVSTLTAEGFDEIKDATELHVDKRDDNQALTMAIGVSNLPAGMFPGYFVQNCLGIYSVTAPYTAEIFTGWLPHKPIAPQWYHPKSIRYEPAMTVPAAPVDLPQCRVIQVNFPNIFARTHPQAMRAVMFTDESLVAWGTMRNRQEYKARQDARKARDARALDFASRTKDDLRLQESLVLKIQTTHKWTAEDGTEELPRREKIEAVLNASVDIPAILNHKLVTESITCGICFGKNQRRGALAWIGGETGIFNDGIPVPDSLLNKPPPLSIRKGNSKTKAERRKIREGPLQYINLVCSVLREELKNRQLKTFGLKSVLVERLKSNDAEANRSAETLCQETRLPPRRHNPRAGLAVGRPQYITLPCDVLREELKNRKLKTTGAKGVLVARLKSNDAEANRSVETFSLDTHIPPNWLQEESAEEGEQDAEEDSTPEEDNALGEDNAPEEDNTSEE